MVTACLEASRRQTRLVSARRIVQGMRKLVQIEQRRLGWTSERGGAGKVAGRVSGDIEADGANGMFYKSRLTQQVSVSMISIV
jgi:hypothetical protein